MKRFFCTLILCLIFFNSGYSQETKFSHSLKTSIFFGNKFRFIVSYGVNVGRHIKISNPNAVTPFLDLKINLYRNFLGSSVIPEYNQFMNGNIAFTGGIYYNNELSPPTDEDQYVPIFASSFANTLNSSYKTNIGISSIYVYQFGFGKNGNYSETQRIANIFASVHGAYLNYYNDGGPVLKYLGDVEDRYWTGGLAFGYIGKIKDDMHAFEASFDKYTGFIKNAFEATGLLYVDNVIYKDLKEVSYNTGKYSLSYTNLSNNIGASFNIWNSKLDFQDRLHRDVTYNPYHHKLEKPHFDFTIFNFLRL